MWLAPKPKPAEGRDLLGHLPCLFFPPTSNQVIYPLPQFTFWRDQSNSWQTLSAGHASNWKESCTWSFQTAKSLWWQVPARTCNHWLLEMKVDEVVWQVLRIESHTPQKESGSMLLTNILTEELQEQHSTAWKGPLGDRRTMAQKTRMPVSTQISQHWSAGLKTSEWQWSSGTGNKLSHVVRTVQ